MNKLMFFSMGLVLLFANCHAGTNTKTKDSDAVSTQEVQPLTTEGFRQKIFNYKINQAWKYEGNLPAIIDFYATWCGPCRIISPRVEEIAKEYKGKIVVYKVDVDAEKELAQLLGIQSIPTLLFIPVKGQPRATMGALPKETLVKTVNEVLLVK